MGAESEKGGGHPSVREGVCVCVCVWRGGGLSYGKMKRAGGLIDHLLEAAVSSSS